MTTRNPLPAPEPSLTFHGSEGPITSLHCISTGSLSGHIISGSLHSSVYLWDATTLKRLLCKFHCDLKAEKNTSVLWTQPDDKNSNIFIQLRDGSLHKWIFSGAQPKLLAKCQINEQHGFCPGAAFSSQRILGVPAGQVGDNSSGVLLVSQDTLAPVGALVPPKNHFTPMRMVRYKENELIVAYEDAVLALWDIRSQTFPVYTSEVFQAKSETLEKDSQGSDDLLTPMALDVDSVRNIGILGSSSNALQRFDITPSEFVLKDSLKLPDDGVSDVRIRPDGKIFTVSSWDFTARVFSWKSLKPLAVLDMHRDVVQRIDYMIIDGKNCTVLGGKDELISVWPLY